MSQPLHSSPQRSLRALRASRLACCAGALLGALFVGAGLYFASHGVAWYKLGSLFLCGSWISAAALAGLGRVRAQLKAAEERASEPEPFSRDSA